MAQHTRAQIATKVRELRRLHRWTQRELADRIGISQNWLSGLERGEGSFTAEQFLELLAIFNVAPDDFGIRPRRDDALVNALHRHGATQLLQNERELPSAELSDVHKTITEALLDASPRIVTAAAPVLLTHAKNLSLTLVLKQLNELGIGRRLPWLVDSTIEAADQLVERLPAFAKRYAKVEFKLTHFASAQRETLPTYPDEDILDHAVRSEKTLDELRRRATGPSRRWNIVTALQTSDFVTALEAADFAR